MTTDASPQPPGTRRALGGSRFGRIGRVLPIAVVQIAGTLLASRIAGGPSGPGPGARPPWAIGGAPSTPVDVVPLAVVLLVAGVVALPWRWSFPRTVLVVTLCTTVGYALLVPARGPFVAALTMAMANAWFRGHRSAVLLSAAVAVAVLPTADDLLGRSPGRDLDAVFLALAWVIVTIVVSELARDRTERVAERRRARAAAEQQRARDERIQIARELHDSVAHSMSLINLQAGVALHLGAGLPEATKESLSSIKDTSRDALVELRAILGVLRSADGTDSARTATATGTAAGSTTETGTARTGTAAETGTAAVAGPGSPARAGTAAAAAPDRVPERNPVPGLDRVPDLVARARAAGVDLSLRVEGDPSTVGGIVDRNAFRIVQESVTNVMKHAPGHRATVAVRVGPDVVELVVDDRPRPDAPPRAGTAAPPSSRPGDAGNGLIGMRERADAVGGTVTAGPLPDGGWRVAARLPRPADSPTVADRPAVTVRPAVADHSAVVDRAEHSAVVDRADRTDHVVDRADRPAAPPEDRA